MAAEYELSFNDYFQIIRRRALHLVSVFLLVFGIVAVIALVTPSVYQSTGTILIESQQIPTEMIQASVTTYADERIEVIRQRVMTRENLLRIIEKYRLYSEGRNSQSASDLIDVMRQGIHVELVSADVGKQRGRATIAFRISFDYGKADVAYTVANELVTLFLDENIKSRTERANETTEFLLKEAERLKGDLEKIENEVATYKQQHSNALPEHLQMRMEMVQRIESEINELERDYKDTQERLRYLDVELASAQTGVQNGAVANLSPASEIERLQAEYSKLSATYKDSHPDLKALKRKIEVLEKSKTNQPVASATAVNPTVGSSSDLKVARVQAQIDAGNGRLVSIDQQRKSLRARLAQLQVEIGKSPQVEHGLTALLRDYETARKKYEEVSSKMGNAKIAENLEQDNKAERFSLLEPPSKSEKPIRPDRKKLIVMGFFMAIAGSVGFSMLLEAINQRVRGVEAITSIIGYRPLAVVPYITTKTELSRRSHLSKYIAAILIAIILIAFLLVHFMFMPLDALMYKVVARLS